MTNTLTDRRTTTRYTSAHQFTTLTPRELCDLTYFAGVLTAIKTEIARITDDTPADVAQYWREELQAAQAQFQTEWDALARLHESRCDARRPDAHATGATERRLASDAHSVAKRRLFAVLNQHAPKLSRDARLRLLSNYLRRDVLSTSDCTATEIHDLATDIDCGRVAIAEMAGVQS